jgi:hypothetical protein
VNHLEHLDLSPDKSLDVRRNFLEERLLVKGLELPVVKRPKYFAFMLDLFD